MSERTSQLSRTRTGNSYYRTGSGEGNRSDTLGGLHGSSLNKERTSDVMARLFRAPHGSRTAALWSMWFSCFLVYYGLGTWMPTLYTMVFHLPIQKALHYAVATNFSAICSSLFCIFSIDRLVTNKLHVRYVCYVFGGRTVIWAATMIKSGRTCCLTLSMLFKVRRAEGPAVAL
jgi:hypothetical protein